jgi:hypothetical protein
LKALRVTSIALFGLLSLLLLAAGVVYLRLQSGPVALGFLNSRIETAINANLSGMHVTLGGAVLEIDPATRVPSVHFQNLAMTDDQGNIIASAPRAAVTLDTSSMFIGRVVPRSLSLRNWFPFSTAMAAVAPCRHLKTSASLGPRSRFMMMQTP